MDYKVMLAKAPGDWVVLAVSIGPDACVGWTQSKMAPALEAGQN